MEKHSSSLNNGSKVKLLCSYGGKIQSRPTDRQLSYVGGDTKILAVDRAVKFSEIIARLNSLSNRSKISVKYQLPGEDLDSLVSLIDDDDVEHMMVEYDRMQRISTKPARLRIFVFDNSARPGPTVAPPNPDYLFGFDKEYKPSVDSVCPPQNYGIGPIGEGHVANWSSGAPGAQVVYRVPAVVSGGMYRSGAYAQPGMSSGNRGQPVYNFIPVMPPIPGPRMAVE